MKITQTTIGKALRWGVLISVFISLIGGIIFLTQQGTEIHSPPIFEGRHPAYSVSSFSDFLTKIIHFDAHALIMLGLMVLLITQFLRVILTAGYFFALNNKLHGWISLLVFCMLAFSFYVGI